MSAALGEYVGTAPRRKIRGFTLIEGLVALAVLSIGMLGIAALYTQALGAGRTTQYRTQAVMLIGDIADRIRANRLAQGAYAGGAGDNGCDPNGGGGVDCDPDEMAAHDLFLWDQQVTQLLPGGQWEIDFNAAAAPPSYDIEVSWEEVGEGRISANLLIQVPTF